MAEDKTENKEKPLAKMTAKELKDVALEIPEISGVHGMNKAELVAAIKAARGIIEETGKKTSASARQLKEKIQALKTAREGALQAKDKKMASVYRRRISRLKKKTRKAA